MGFCVSTGLRGQHCAIVEAKMIGLLSGEKEQILASLPREKGRGATRLRVAPLPFLVFLRNAF